MACFMSCAAADEIEERAKKSCSFSIRQFVNMFHQSEGCSMTCAAEDVEQGRKRFCFVSFFIAMRNRFR